MRRKVKYLSIISVLLYSVVSFVGCKESLVSPQEYGTKPVFSNIVADTNNSDFSKVRYLLLDNSDVLWGMSDNNVVKYSQPDKWVVDSHFNPTANYGNNLGDGSLAFYGISKVSFKTSSGNYIIDNLPKPEIGERYINGISGKSMNDFCVATITITQSYTFTSSIFTYKLGKWKEYPLPEMGHYMIYNLNYNEQLNCYTFIGFKRTSEYDSAPYYKVFTYHPNFGLREVASSYQFVTLKMIGTEIFSVIDNQLVNVQEYEVIPIAKFPDEYMSGHMAGTSGSDLYFTGYNCILHFDGKRLSKIYQLPTIECSITDILASEKHLYFNVMFLGLDKDVMYHANR